MPDLANLYPGCASRRIDTSAAIESGHYLPEETPDATAQALLEFFGAG
jgi:hypothetical protein